VTSSGLDGLAGLVIVDKPAGWTSHDVVARLRRLARTRRVGHAGTLDPLATGVLVVGLGRATRLLGYLTLAEKAYDATIRLGVTTVTDDAEGEVISTASAGEVTADAIRTEIAALTGEFEQVPARVSAVKVAGRRAYARVRAGEEVDLPPRRVTVSAFELRDVRRHAAVVDLDVEIRCSSGTYVRALARDLGAALGIGGHLTALRRTRVGAYGLDQARTLDELASDLAVIPLGAAVAAAFPRQDVSADEARVVGHGGWLPTATGRQGPIGLFGPGEELLALAEERGGRLRPLVVFAPAQTDSPPRS
jgi:tRNA pseudouridine55 synthase